MSAAELQRLNAEVEAGLLFDGRATADGPVEGLARAATRSAMVVAAVLVVATGATMLVLGNPLSSTGASGEGVVSQLMHDCPISGENCTTSRCCAEPGYQCYRKNEVWSSCMLDCAEGKILEGDPDPTPWGCEKLGSRTPTSETPKGSETSRSAQDDYEDGYCPTIGKNCTAARCCAEPGFQCYKKNEAWAGCMQNCTKGKVLKGDPDATPWSCEELGPRTYKPASKEYDYCASRGEDCRSMGCCAGAQDSCYLKNPEWGSCMPSCTSTGNWTKDWSCEMLY